MTTPPQQPAADFHQPGELLATATRLVKSRDRDLLRAAVLESISALEAAIAQRVLPLLHAKVDPQLAKWAEDKTRMDFDSRLGVLTPVALQQPIDTASDLWQRYKKAKEIRNKVTHSGRRVSQKDAEFVLQTVYDWLAFLGSTAEIEVALLTVKREVESVMSKSQLLLPDFAEKMVRGFFTRAPGVTEVHIDANTSRVPRPDLVVEFGERRVFVEIKQSRGSFDGFMDTLAGAVETCRVWLDGVDMPARAAVVLLHPGELPDSYDGVRTVEDGQVSVVGIRIRG